MTESSETEQSSRIDYAARRHERAHERALAAGGRTWLLAAAGAVAVVVLLVTVEVAASVGRVHPGVTISGVKVGGMTPRRAATALERELGRRAATPVVLAEGDRRWTVAAEQVGLAFDTDAAVDDAMEVGRDTAMIVSVAERVRSWTSGIDVPASSSFDAEKLEAALAAIAADIDVAPEDASVKVESGEPIVIPGSDGRALDRLAAAELLTKAFASQGVRNVEAPVKVAKVKVTDAEAQDAADAAKAMLGAPVTVVYEKKTWEFSPATVGAWLAFRPVSAVATTDGAEADSKLEPYVEPKKATKPVTSAIGSGVGRLAKDATFETNSGAVTIVPSQDGIGPDIESLSIALTEELKDASADRRVELRTTRTQPKITTADARKMGIRERISGFATTFDAGNLPRVKNIRLLGDSLDGTLIPPGGTFSFNETAGERTAAKGYQEANAIVNGRLVPQLGGGICQVATTVFNAVYDSGLPVVERRNHSFYISLYPTGRDAAVSWGGPDLRFTNDTEDWVLVSVSYTSTSITVALYGTDPGYDVDTKVGAWSSIRPFPIETVKDPKLSAGVKVIEDPGVTGRRISVERIVKKDGKVVRTDTFRSNYNPKIQVVRIGTKKSGSKPATATP